jgi:hypothetical protein
MPESLTLEQCCCEGATRRSSRLGPPDSLICACSTSHIARLLEILHTCGSCCVAYNRTELRAVRVMLYSVEATASRVGGLVNHRYYSTKLQRIYIVDSHRVGYFRADGPVDPNCINLLVAQQSDQLGLQAETSDQSPELSCRSNSLYVRQTLVSLGVYLCHLAWSLQHESHVVGSLQSYKSLYTVMRESTSLRLYEGGVLMRTDSDHEQLVIGLQALQGGSSANCEEEPHLISTPNTGREGASTAPRTSSVIHKGVVLKQLS